MFLLSMFFITFVGYLYGLRAGLTSALAYGLLQLLMGPYIISIPQLVCDYILAFGYLEGRALKNGKRRRIKALLPVFPLNVLRFLPSILFNVNRVKLQEYLGFLFDYLKGNR